MTSGKKVYDERRRLEAANKLRREQRIESQLDKEERMEAWVAKFFADIGRIADALEAKGKTK